MTTVNDLPETFWPKVHEVRMLASSPEFDGTSDGNGLLDRLLQILLGDQWVRFNLSDDVTINDDGVEVTYDTIFCWDPWLDITLENHNDARIEVFTLPGGLDRPVYFILWNHPDSPHTSIACDDAYSFFGALRGLEPGVPIALLDDEDLLRTMNDFPDDEGGP